MQFRSLIFSAVLLLAAASFCSAATVDPWLYSGRSSLWAPLINATLAPQMGDTSNDKSNWFWGFALQFNWQYNSGRLFNRGDSISPTSWWAAMNYYLTIPPYLAAAELGMVPEVTIKAANSGPNKFCTTADSCDQTLMSYWRDAMKGIQSCQKGSSMTADQLLDLVWDAHTYTIKSCITMFKDEANQLSTTEYAFGHGWALFVEVIASTHFVTNYTSVIAMQTYLPPRALKLTDVPPFIGDMSAGTNAMISSMVAVHLLDKVNGFDPLLSLWQKAMQSPRCQMLGRYVISNFLIHPVDSLIEVVKNVMSSCTSRDPAMMQMLQQFDNHFLAKINQITAY